MDKFLDTYRIPSARLQNWDYGWNAAYFITICTANRDCYFGAIKEGKMQLSNMGILADVFWHEIKNHAKNIRLDAFVVMPNHVHGILILDNGDGRGNDRDTQKPKNQTIGQKRFQNQGKNTLSSIIGSYKAAVTKHAHRLEYDFAWQPRFYDHIIRDNESYQNIQNYIINNPQNWDKDKFSR